MNTNNPVFRFLLHTPQGMGIVAAAALIGALLTWRYGVPAAATAEEATPATLEVELFGPGRLDATARALLSPKATGRIVEMHAQSGDRIASGMPLIRLQADSAQALLEQSRGERKSAQAQVAAALADRSRTEARLTQATRDHTRLQDLSVVSPDATSAGDLDLSASTLETAHADYLAARAKVTAARSALAAAEAVVAYQLAQLGDTVLRAPFSGRVTQRIHSVGDTINPGTGILELVDESTVFVEARFDESVLSSLAINAPARVVFRQTEPMEVPGRIVRIDRVVDGETREFTAQIALDALPEWWALGQRLDVHVKARLHAPATVRNSEVLRDKEGTFVWILRDGRARRQRVTIGSSAGDRVQIVSGLAPQERVIRPTVRLFSGRPIYVAG